MIAKLPVFRFTVAEYDRMIDTGILTEDDRVEFIRGEIVQKMPIGGLHVECVNALNKHFTRHVSDNVTVSVQNPIVLADSEPEPDVSLVDGTYPSRHSKPHTGDVFLVVEVAESSIEVDCGPKAELYAENGVVEYWIVDLNENAVLVHRGPQPDGTWATVTAHGRNDTLTVAALPTVTIAVADILP